VRTPWHRSSPPDPGVAMLLDVTASQSLEIAHLKADLDEVTRERDALLELIHTNSTNREFQLARMRKISADIEERRIAREGQ